MFFNEEQLVLPDNKIDAAKAICQHYYSVSESRELDDEHYISAFVFLLHFCKANFPAFPISIDEIANSENVTSDTHANYNSFSQYLRAVSKVHAIEDANKRYSSLFETDHFVTFTDDEISRIQILINQLRDLISDSLHLDEKHKQRILRRLEKMQSELHKRMSDVDWFWGFLGDAGVAVKKFGQDCEPLVNCIKELANIVWRAQAISAGLPPTDQFPLIAYSTTSSEETGNK